MRNQTKAGDAGEGRRLTAAQRRVLRDVVNADDGYLAKATEPLFVKLWERDLLHFYAPESLWFISDAGCLALQSQEAGDVE